jgi:hypothetical protein
MRKSKAKKKGAKGAAEKIGEEIQDAAGSTESLRAVPPENASKVKFGKKVILIVCLVLLLGAFFLSSRNRSSSQILIKTQKDKFRVDFLIDQKDRANVSGFLEKLGIPQTVAEGLEFRLDSTSSAKLAFTNPITLNLNFSQESVSFSGSSHSPLIDAYLSPQADFKLPADTKIALFSQDFRQVITKNFEMPPALKEWINKNITGLSGQYLVIFGENNDFFLSAEKSAETDFSKLEQIKENEGEPLYKQEADSQITIHLIRIPQEEGTTFAFFEIGQTIFLASSHQSAKNTISVQKGEAPIINFPRTGEDVSFAAFFKKTGETEGILSLFTQNSQIAKRLENIKQAQLVISGNEIEGYVDF